MGRYCGDPTNPAGGCEFYRGAGSDDREEIWRRKSKAGIAKRKNTLSSLSPNICVMLTSWRTFIEKKRPKNACDGARPHSARWFPVPTIAFWLPVWARTLLTCCWKAMAVVVSVSSERAACSSCDIIDAIGNTKRPVRDWMECAKNCTD